MNLVFQGLIPLDVLVGDMEEIQEDAAVMEALYHLVNFKALGSKEDNHKVGLGTEGYELCNSILRALGYIHALISEMRVKKGLVNKENGAISKLLQVLESLGLFSPKLDIVWCRDLDSKHGSDIGTNRLALHELIQEQQLLQS